MSLCHSHNQSLGTITHTIYHSGLSVALCAGLSLTMFVALTATLLLTLSVCHSLSFALSLTPDSHTVCQSVTHTLSVACHSRAVSHSVTHIRSVALSRILRVALPLRHTSRSLSRQLAHPSRATLFQFLTRCSLPFMLLAHGTFLHTQPFFAQSDPTGYLT